MRRIEKKLTYNSEAPKRASNLAYRVLIYHSHANKAVSLLLFSLSFQLKYMETILSRPRFIPPRVLFRSANLPCRCRLWCRYRLLCCLLRFNFIHLSLCITPITNRLVRLFKIYSYFKKRIRDKRIVSKFGKQKWLFVSPVFCSFLVWRNLNFALSTRHHSKSYVDFEIELVVLFIPFTMHKRNTLDTKRKKQKRQEPVSSTSRCGDRAAYHDEYPGDFSSWIAYTVS